MRPDLGKSPPCNVKMTFLKYLVFFSTNDKSGSQKSRVNVMVNTVTQFFLHFTVIFFETIPVSSLAVGPHRCRGCNQFAVHSPLVGFSSPSDCWQDTGFYWEGTPDTPSSPLHSPSPWKKHREGSVHSSLGQMFNEHILNLLGNCGSVAMHYLVVAQ